MINLLYLLCLRAGRFPSGRRAWPGRIALRQSVQTASDSAPESEDETLTDDEPENALDFYRETLLSDHISLVGLTPANP
eukprot:5123475-Alexandrium_andersonii.AAC.1